MSEISEFFTTYGVYIVPILFGGVAGATLTYFLTERRNRVQPIGKRLSVTHVNLQSMIPGYSPKITLMHNTNEEPYHFSGLAIIRLELANSGNKDFDLFDVGIDLPEDSSIIGIQSEGQDRYHSVHCLQEVTMESIRLSKLDLELKPFHRNDKYAITLIVNTTDKDLAKKIFLSKSQSVKFVDMDYAIEVASSVSGVFFDLFYPRLGNVIRNF